MFNYKLSRLHIHMHNISDHYIPLIVLTPHCPHGSPQTGAGTPAQRSCGNPGVPAPPIFLSFDPGSKSLNGNIKIIIV